jgi:hypothetical protein
MVDRRKGPKTARLSSKRRFARKGLRAADGPVLVGRPWAEFPLRAADLTDQRNN